MGSLLVIEPGMFTTIQDLGREGWGACGIAAGGAAESLSLRACNRLLGNDQNAAGLEFTLLGATLLAQSDATIALSAGFSAARVLRPDDTSQPIAPWTTIDVDAGHRIRLGPLAGRSRAYLCIRGGLHARHLLGSASTHVSGSFGGLSGRSLSAGDRLEFADAPRLAARHLSSDAQRLLEHHPSLHTLAAVAGPQHDQFSTPSAVNFWNSSFTISSQSDRVGIRLEGPTILSPAAGRLISQGVPPGAIQIPENGKPIVLGVDHPTTGGYPVIACVASVEMDTLGRCRPGDTLAFRRVSIDEARDLWRTREHRFSQTLGTA